ncbi:hypothetical protein [Streptomyces cyaneofuscatus]|uniref:hypothetical protein n=1 Tax=Streptomyces cyaneofuscatus TaxID=66883 RepID=UPI00332E40CE
MGGGIFTRVPVLMLSAVFRGHKLFFTEQELAEWRTWAGTVFIPQHPGELCAQVSGYEITAARWAQGRYDEHLSVIPFPAGELMEYTRDRFTRLKREQAVLLGHTSAGPAASAVRPHAIGAGRR